MGGCIIRCLLLYGSLLIVAIECQICDRPETFSPECVAGVANNLSRTKGGHIGIVAARINDLMDAPKTSLLVAQETYNSTDKVLKSLDMSVGAIADDHLVLRDSHLLIHIFNARTTNIAGVIVYENDEGFISDAEIYRNTSLDKALQIGHFKAAAYMPEDLLEQIIADVQKPIVAVTVFLKDGLFALRDQSLGEVVFGVIIPDFRGKFVTPMKLAFKIAEGDNREKDCAHWIYNDGMTNGKWDEGQDSNVCGAVEVCEYYEVTHSGMLVSGGDDDRKKHRDALELITFIGCSLSFVSLLGIFITGILFSKWRANKGNIILLNYALATLFEIITMYVSKYFRETALCDKTWCFVSGLFFHYFVLAQFFWVLIISYLQYKRYVQIIGVPTNKLILKSCLIAWLGPLPMIILLCFFFDGNFVNNNADVCYPSGWPLYVALIAPIVIIVLVNFGVFAMILKSIFHDNMEIPRLADNVMILRVRLVFLLFFQLGLCWIFLFLGKISIVFTYLFVITAPNQGVVVFLLFIVFNRASNQFYKQMCGCDPKKLNGRVQEPSTRST